MAIARNHNDAHNRTEVRYNYICILFHLHYIPNIDYSNFCNRMFVPLTDPFHGQPDNVSMQVQTRLKMLAQILHKRQDLCLRELNRILVHHDLALLAMTQDQSLDWSVVTHNANLSLPLTNLSGNLHHHHLQKMNQVQVSQKMKMKVMKATMVAWPLEKYLMEETRMMNNCF